MSCIRSAGKDNIIDQGGYEVIRRPGPRAIGQYAPEIFAVDADRAGDSVTTELSKKRFCGDVCSKESCSHWGCKEQVGAV